MLAADDGTTVVRSGPSQWVHSLSVVFGQPLDIQRRRCLLHSGCLWKATIRTEVVDRVNDWNCKLVAGSHNLLAGDRVIGQAAARADVLQIERLVTASHEVVVLPDAHCC
jgi:hypothetical protein